MAVNQTMQSAIEEANRGNRPSRQSIHLPVNLNISSHGFSQNVHAYFAQMREDAPVYQARLNRWQSAYLITRYEDVLDALKDPRLIKDANGTKTDSGRSAGLWIPKTFQPLMHNMLNKDEPDHRRLRNLVHKAFTPRMIMDLAPRIEAIAEELLDKAAHKNDVELVRDFALPLPVTVIAEMIGIPPADRAMFRAWTERIIVNPTPWNMVRAVPAVSSFMKYMRKLADQRRVDPQDDLLTALVQAEDAGDRFTENELLGMAFLLLVAGHETTVSLITNGTLALLNHPDQLDLLRGNPALADSAVEELLRYDGPLQTTEFSYAKQAISLHGVTIPKGATVLPAILSANRDERVFTNPNQLDITRSPNKHLAFGHGIHYCLGAPLARLEGKIAFTKLIERAPNLRLTIAPEAVEFQSLLILHRAKSLPVQF